MYEVWLFVDAKPARQVAQFRRFGDAEQYVRGHRREGPFDIKFPNGRWHGRSKTVDADEIAAFLAAIPSRE